MLNLYWLIIIGVLIIVGLLILENRAAKRKKLKLYTLSDSIVNFSSGLLERVFDVFFSVIVLFGFNYIYQNIAPFQISLSPISWIIALFITDFIAYWFHRLSHEVNFLWAAHIVHHQSEELNITTVFRVSFLAVIYRAFFFVWMAFAGFDVFTIVSTSVFLGFYQLFTHSRVIGKLGFIEKFMTTPSHHRVHHGRNEKYMDQNYSHIFIFWDKLFGTFVEEEEEPDYGITSGFEKANVIDTNFSYWKNLFTRASKTKTIKNKINVFLKGPAWTPEDVNHLPNQFKTDINGERVPHKISIKKETQVYIVLSVLITAVSFIGLLFIKSQLAKEVGLYELITNKNIVSLVGIILISVLAHSAIIEDKRFWPIIDFVRLVSIFSLTIFGFSNTEISFWLIPAIAIYCLVMLLWLVKMNIKPFRNTLSA